MTADNTTTQASSVHGTWTKRWTFVLAASGSAVGLGNIWKFPYITGENGGSAFVLIYLVCILAIGIPIMIAETLLGRRGRKNPIHTMRDMVTASNASGFWHVIGIMGTLTGILILSYYSVIAGWALAYIPKLAGGEFSGATGALANSIFGGEQGFLSQYGTLIFWHSLFTIVTVYVVAQGIEAGLERAVRFLMPALMILLLILLVYSALEGAFAKGAAFLFTFDISKLSWNSALTALGHAFFTLSIGMCAIMAYGAYMPKQDSITKTITVIAVMDTGIALVAGLVIFPLVFAHGLEPSAGPGLMFISLPLAFGHITGGQLFGALFFTLVAFAAWTSAISLLEPGVAWLIERFGFSRRKAALTLGASAWVLGLGSVFSFNIWQHYKFAGMFTVFDGLDFLTSNIMLPLGGLLIAIFAGWVMKPEMVDDELRMESPWLRSAWWFALRYISPTAVAVVFVLGVYDKFAG
ncbi:MAG: sodium-dependent transporter [Pseudomonadales bacterium]|nr:sodium-dependent transporter [Pseudomonadales bacterium]